MSSSPLDLSERLDLVIAKALREKRLVGCVVAVAEQGRTIYRKAHGLNDREAAQKMHEGDIFRLSSLTKAITAMAVLKLVEQGKLGLEDPITHYLPGFTPKLRDGSTPEIRLRHLLTHTSGLSSPFLETQNGPYHSLKIADGLADSGSLSLDENIKRLAKAPLLFEPGRGWQYSLGLDVLGKVIELVSEQNLERAIAELITDPLDMRQTRFRAAPTLALAVPYADHKPEPIRMDSDVFHHPIGESEVVFSPKRAYDPNAFLSGGSGMISCVDDYLNFLEAIRTNRLLKPENTQRIFQNTTGQLSIPLAGPGFGWGLIGALLLDPQKAGRPMAPFSSGWSGVYGHTWWIDPTNEISTVILTNTSFEGTSGRFPDEIRAEVFAHKS